jgi:hypothetical protein
VLGSNDHSTGALQLSPAQRSPWRCQKYTKPTPAKGVFRAASQKTADIVKFGLRHPKEWAGPIRRRPFGNPRPNNSALISNSYLWH